MTPINFQKRYFFPLAGLLGLLFQLCMKPQCKNVNSAFEFHWSKATKHKNRYNRWNSLAQCNRQKKKGSQPQFQVAIQTVSQSVSLYQHWYHVYPMSFVRLISNEWWGIFRSSRLNLSSLWFTAIEMSTFGVCTVTFFFFSVFVALLLSCSQYKQHVSTDLLNRKSISIKRQRARNADTHKIPVCLSMNHNEHKISLHTAVKSLWIITCNLHTLDVCNKQSLCRFDELGVTF